MTQFSQQEHLFDALSWQLARTQRFLLDGSHRGHLSGAGGAFADIAPLLAFPDTRRLDLRRSITDPTGGFFVRRFERHTDITLHILLDATGSLASSAAADRLGLATLLSTGLARAACRGGDRFAVQAVGGTDILIETPPARSLGLASQIGPLMAGLEPKGHGVAALCEAAASLPTQRILIALISDFELSTAELDQLLGALSPRPVLPIWLRDSGLENPSPRFGLTEMQDPETGRRRAMITSRKWAARQAAAMANHRKSLRSVAGAYGLTPIEICDSIDIERLIEALDEARL